MKLYIATLILHAEYEITATTFVAESSNLLASQVIDYLEADDTPFDSTDILMECENGNQQSWNEPLSIGADTDLSREYLLTTTIKEV